MIRVKEFNSTGVAPNGRLYAGDLLAIMDAAAGLADFAQTIDLSTLRIGDTGIQLLKHGTAEARISAALRTDGILRGLGGIYAGAFTTTQRDAIGAGFRPHGLVILNTTTVQYEWNKGTDGTPDWQPLAPLPTAEFNFQAGSYTLVLSDANKIVEMLAAGANTLTVPPNASVAFPVGTQITIVQTGNGQTTIAPGAGVTINATPGLKLASVWAGATLIKRATNAWVAIGNLVP